MTSLILLASILITPIQECQMVGQHTKNVVFVIDTSGSMVDDMHRAWSAWSQISEQPTDDMKAWVIAFKDCAYRFAYQDKTGKIRYDLELPNAQLLGKASGWINALGSGGDTEFTPALEVALSIKHKDLTVVVISDFVFYSECTDKIVKRREELQEARVDAGYGRAKIACLGVGAQLSLTTLKKIVDQGGGFLVSEARSE